MSLDIENPLHNQPTGDPASGSSTNRTTDPNLQSSLPDTLTTDTSVNTKSKPPSWCRGVMDKMAASWGSGALSGLGAIVKRGLLGASAEDKDGFKSDMFTKKQILVHDKETLKEETSLKNALTQKLLRTPTEEKRGVNEKLERVEERILKLERSIIEGENKIAVLEQKIAQEGGSFPSLEEMKTSLVQESNVLEKTIELELHRFKSEMNALGPDHPTSDELEAQKKATDHLYNQFNTLQSKIRAIEAAKQAIDIMSAPGVYIKDALSGFFKK